MGNSKKCAVVGCPNRRNKNISKEISFHSFPLDSARNAQWVSALNRTNWKPNTQSILCSEHFRPEDLDKTSQCVSVQQNAIPSIFPHQSASKQNEVREIEQSSQEIPNSRPNPSNNKKVILVYESSSDDSLILEAYPEELSPAQLSFQINQNNEEETLNQKIKVVCNQPNVEVVPVYTQTLIDIYNTCSANRGRKRSNSKTSLEIDNNSPINLNLEPNVQSKPEPNGKGRNPQVSNNNSKPSIVSRALSGLIAEPINYSKLVLTSVNAKQHAEMMVVVKPHLVVKEFTKDDCLQLAKQVKTILSYDPKKFTEWLFYRGLLKSPQICICNPSAPLQLTFTNDLTRLTYSGGYFWLSDCCPDKIVSVFKGSFFEISSYPPSEILKQIYYWCCQVNFKGMVKYLKVDNTHMRAVNFKLRAICTVVVQTDVGLLGGPGKKVEIGMTTLMGTQLSKSDKRVIPVLGILEPETKQIRLYVLESNFDDNSNNRRHLEKVIEILSHWIHPESILAIDTTINKNALINRGFTNIQQSASTDQNPCNQSIMKYLREILPPMFNNTLSLLSFTVIQQCLDELVWRERYGATRSECFKNILNHISQQTTRFNNIFNSLTEVIITDRKENWRLPQL